MTDKKFPKFVGIPKTVSGYEKGIKERQEKAKKPGVPNLAAAEAVQERDSPPQTIANLAQAAEDLAGVETGAVPPGKGLSPQTVQGMQALHAAAQKQLAESPPKKPPVVEPAEDPEAERREQATDALSGLDDWELQRLMDGINSDIINNPEQKKAIAELVGDFDLAKGLATGEWEQDVPIVPDTFHVRFRLVSPYENQMIRLLLSEWVAEDPRREDISPEIYSLMMIVASVVNINGDPLPPHLVGQEAYRYEFVPESFKIKYETLCRYPNPLIHAIGVHSGWFDLRVRESLRVTKLKAG